MTTATITDLKLNEEKTRYLFKFGGCQAWHTGHRLRYGKKLIELIDQTMKESA